jgi:hypothetical protein
MTKQIVITIKNNINERVTLDINSNTPSITLKQESNPPKNYSGADIYQCLGKMIKDHSDTDFLCKGAKRTVRPSSMSSQMCSGVVAYELVLGRHASHANLVNIFDYEDQDIIRDPQLQEEYFHHWRDSLREDGE